MVFVEKRIGPPIKQLVDSGIVILVGESSLRVPEDRDPGSTFPPSSIPVHFHMDMELSC